MIGAASGAAAQAAAPDATGMARPSAREDVKADGALPVFCATSGWADVSTASR